MSGEKGHKYTFRELVSLRRTPEKIKKNKFQGFAVCACKIHGSMFNSVRYKASPSDNGWLKLL